MSDVPTPTRRDLVQALAYSPTSRDIYYNLTRCEQAMRQYDAAPTPDDRDREVERIAAVLRSIWALPEWPTGPENLGAALYDAGLRASGGD